jgi:hypothetical protein
MAVAAVYKLTIISTEKKKHYMCESRSIFSTLRHEDSHIGHENVTPKISLCIYITAHNVE